MMRPDWQYIWKEFKIGWREAGELQRRIFPWVLLASAVVTALMMAFGWR